MMRYLLACSLVSMSACGEPPEEVAEAPVSEERNIIANNAFFYYADLEAATDFYVGLLGLRVAADYGFAKILQIASTSYLTLVDAESGMHSADEPKTVAMALLTDELEGWYDYLKSEDVPMRSELKAGEDRPHDGFVVYDPEGYYLEFERFNPHPENEKLIPVLEEAVSFYPEEGQDTKRPKDLGLEATVIWMYYKDMENIQRFYEDVMGFEMIVDQGWTKIYRTSPTGFIGLVDESRGMHRFTEDKGVTVSFFTDHVDAWFDYMSRQESFELRTKEIFNESDSVRVFVGYDPENYFLEFDTFLDVEANERLLELLEGARLK